MSTHGQLPNKEAGSTLGCMDLIGREGDNREIAACSKIEVAGDWIEDGGICGSSEAGDHAGVQATEKKRFQTVTIIVGAKSNPNHSSGTRMSLQTI